MILKFFLGCALLFAPALFSLEHSIVPLIDRIEAGKGPPSEKYSTEQWVEILNAIAKKKESLRIVSYNVLFTRYEEALPENYKWAQRLPRLVHTIEEMQPDLLGIQELLPSQREALVQALSKKYAFFVSNKDSPYECGIFYNKNRFRVLSSDAYELAPKASNGIASSLHMLHLEDQITEQKLAFFTTHLSFSDLEQREAEAKKINAFLSRFAKAHPETSLILTGDFNTFPNRPELDFPFFDGPYIEKLLEEGLLVNARLHAILGTVGPLSTFTSAANSAQPFQGHGTPGLFLDHIFVSPELSVLIFAVNPATEGGLWPSDHMPILADIALSEKKPQKWKKERTEQDSNL